MASVVDALDEALHEDLSCLKIILYAIPVYFAAKLFLAGKTGMFIFYGGLVGILLFGLLTQGINNVRRNKTSILSINPVELGIAVIKTAIVMIPQILIFGIIGKWITGIHIPIELPYTQLVYAIIIWVIIFSIVMTSYLSFAKYLKISQAFNLKVIGESCIDVLISFLFFIPQLIFANIVLIGPVAYLYFVFHLPYNHWGFIAYCSAAVVVNISIMANYLAQSSYEHIKGSNEEYEDNVQINIISDVPEKLN